MTTRIRSDRFHDTWTVQVGPEANRIRREIMAEQDEALRRFDEDPNPENRAKLLTADGIEREVGRRIGRVPAAPRATSLRSPEPVPVSALTGNARSRRRVA